MDVPNPSTKMNLDTHIFEWHVLRCGSKNYHQANICLNKHDYMSKVC